MSRNMKIRVKRNEDGPGALVMARHADRSDVAPGTIEQLSFQKNGETVADVFIGRNVAASPLTMICVEKADSGDTLSVCWRNSRGKSARAEATLR